MKQIHFVNEDERRRISVRLSKSLAEEPEVVFAFLYGSFADSEAFHDVDVGVHLRGLGSGSPVAVALAERLSARIGLPVDIRVLNAAPMTFLYHVFRGHLLICQDHALLGDVMEDTSRRYLDNAPLLRHSTKEAFAR